MIGNLYFILKNTILTVIIVCLLQIQFGRKTLEDRLMTFVRHTVAPNFLGTETQYITNESIKFSPQDLSNIRNKIYNSSAVKGVTKNARKLLLKEMETVLQEAQDKKMKEFKEMDSLDKKQR